MPILRANSKAVSQKLPEKDQKVFVCSDRNDGVFADGKFWSVDEDGNEFDCIDPSHWMPIPTIEKGN